MGESSTSSDATTLNTGRLTILKIILPGIPVPQARMKHSNRRGFVKTYDPRAKEKSAIRHLLNAFKTDQEFKYPHISFMFHMPIPKSIKKKEEELYQSEILKHDKKPDVDNLVKLYLDCLDGIIIHGDQKVSLGVCIKVYSAQPRTVIWLSDTSGTICEQDVTQFPSDVKSDLLQRVEKVFQRDSYNPEK